MTSTIPQTDTTPKPPVRHGFVVWIATGFGFGFSPIMPGTAGAAWGLLLAWGVAQVPALGSVPALALQAVLIAAICLIGVPVCTAAARQLGLKDPGCVTFDEIASMPLVFLLVPRELMSSIWVLLAGFVLHRIFDITKPPPARLLERLPEGQGIMADDLIAGAYACLALHVLLWSCVVG